VDRYLRDEALAILPLHPNQYAYRAGKSVETAQHQLVLRIEKALDQKEIDLGAFLNIEGAIKIPAMTPCVMLSSGMVVIIPSCDRLEPPWRAAWLSRPLMTSP
jgi:hypothetical protein